jgi:hemin uptake protein HemP
MILTSACLMNDDPTKPPPSLPDANETPVFDLRELLKGGREAIIVHGRERYRLRVTANDKLILTK